ncbi:MAG: HAD-IA family hydrolase [archaeon]|jgi:putative hydrolase of the HAD superfamily|nr:HAD-IA family hydrolase [archaeon]
MVKAIILDFGGVLATRGCWPALAEKFSASLGIDEQLILNHLYGQEHPLLRGKQSTAEFWEQNLRGIGITFDEFEKAFVHWYQLNQEVLKLALELKKKFKLVILSDNFDAVTPTIRSDPALKIFDKMFFSNEMHKIKQDAGVFEEVLEKIKLKPKDCVFVDDHKENFVRAKELGIKCVLFTGVESIGELE